MRASLANVLSGFRILAVLPTVYFVLHQQWGAASSMIALAMLSDLLDGPVARRSGAASAQGGLLDHSCDAVFVSCGLFALAHVGHIPVLLPILVIASFTQYVLDSRVLAGKSLRTSTLGRGNGVAYFVLLGVAAFNQVFTPALIPQSWISIAAWALILSSLVSMADRALALWNVGSAS